MSTTGTYDFALNALDVIEEAFERCGRDPADLNHRHLSSAIRSVNLLGVEIENDADIPFRIDRIEQALSQNQRGFFLPVGTIDVLAAYLKRTTNGVDSVIPLRRFTPDHWEQLPKTQSSTPVQYAVSKALPGELSLIDSEESAGEAGAWGPGVLQEGQPTHRPALVFWPATDKADDVFVYHRLRSAQDVAALSDSPDYARNWLEAICAGLARRLAVKWAPDRIAMLGAEWEVAKANAFRGGRSRDAVMVYGRGIGHPLRRRRI